MSYSDNSKNKKMSYSDNPLENGENIQNRDPNFTFDSKDTESIKNMLKRTNPSNVNPIFLPTNTGLQIPEKKNIFKFFRCRYLVVVLPILVIVLMFVVIVYRAISKKVDKEVQNIDPPVIPVNPDRELDIIPMFNFFKYKYKSNKKNSVIFSDKALKIMKNMSHDINILSYNYNLDCVLMYYGYSGSGENKTIYGCAYIEKINDFLDINSRIGGLDEVKDFDIHNSEDIPLVIFTMDHNKTITNISYNMKMDIKYLNILVEFIIKSTNSSENIDTEKIETENSSDLIDEVEPLKNLNNFNSKYTMREGIIKEIKIEHNVNLSQTSKMKYINYGKLDYNSKSNNKKDNDSLNNLRTLKIATNKTIELNYHIFEIKLISETKISLNAYIGIIPDETQLKLKLFFKSGDNEKIIFEKKVPLNMFFNLSNENNNIYDLLSYKIEESLKDIDENLNNFKTNIELNLDSFLSLISNIDIIQYEYPYKDFTSLINEYIKKSFDESFQLTNNLLENTNNLLDNETFTSLKLNTEKIINDLLNNQEDILNEISNYTINLPILSTDDNVNVDYYFFNYIKGELEKIMNIRDNFISYIINLKNKYKDLIYLYYN